jgi:hypothetical protein
VGELNLMFVSETKAVLIHIDQRQKEVEQRLKCALESDKEEGAFFPFFLRDTPFPPLRRYLLNPVDLEGALRLALDSKFGLDSPMVKEVSRVLAQKRKARTQEADVKVCKQGEGATLLPSSPNVLFLFVLAFDRCSAMF